MAKDFLSGLNHLLTKGANKASSSYLPALVCFITVYHSLLLIVIQEMKLIEAEPVPTLSKGKRKFSRRTFSVVWRPVFFLFIKAESPLLITGTPT